MFPIFRRCMKKCCLFFTFELDVFIHVFISPVAEIVDYRYQGFTCFRERILHFRRDLRVHLSDDKAIFLQFAKFFCQHPLGDPGRYPIHDLAKTQRPVLELVDDQRLPFAPDHIQGCLDSPAVFELFWCGIYLLFPSAEIFKNTGI